jgi:hypothetical protein
MHNARANVVKYSLFKCCAGQALVTHAHLRNNLQFRSSLNPMLIHPGVQVATAEPYPRSRAVANENWSQAPVVAIDPLGRHAEVGCCLIYCEKMLGTQMSSLGTGWFVGC